MPPLGPRHEYEYSTCASPKTSSMPCQLTMKNQDHHPSRQGLDRGSGCFRMPPPPSSLVIPDPQDADTVVVNNRGNRGACPSVRYIEIEKYSSPTCASDSYRTYLACLHIVNHSRHSLVAIMNNNKPPQSKVLCQELQALPAKPLLSMRSITRLTNAPRNSCSPNSSPFHSWSFVHRNSS